MNYGKIPLGVLVTFGVFETQAMAQQPYPMQRPMPQATMPQAGMPHPAGHSEHAGKPEHSEHSEHEEKKEHSEHSEHAEHGHAGKKEHSEHSGKKEGGEEGLSPVKKELIALLEQNKDSSIPCKLAHRQHTIRPKPMIDRVKKEGTEVKREKDDFIIDYKVGSKEMRLTCPKAALEN